MEFKRTDETLHKLKETEEITLRDVLGLFVEDICKDTDIARLPFGDPDDTVLWLCQLSRMIARIYKNNQKIFDSPDYKNQWEKAEEKLNQAMGQLEPLYLDLKEKRDSVQRLFTSLQEDASMVKQWTMDRNRAEQLINDFSCEMENAVKISEKYEQLLEFFEKGDLQDGM